MTNEHIVFIEVLSIVFICVSALVLFSAAMYQWQKKEVLKTFKIKYPVMGAILLFWIDET